MRGWEGLGCVVSSCISSVHAHRDSDTRYSGWQRAFPCHPPMHLVQLPCPAWFLPAWILPACMRSQLEARLTLLLSRRRSLLPLPFLPVFPLPVSPLVHVSQEGGRGLVLAVVESRGRGRARDAGCGHKRFRHGAEMVITVGEKLRCKRKSAWNSAADTSARSRVQPRSPLRFGRMFLDLVGRFGTAAHICHFGLLLCRHFGQFQTWTIIIFFLSSAMFHIFRTPFPFSDHISNQCSIQCP